MGERAIRHDMRAPLVFLLLLISCLAPSAALAQEGESFFMLHMQDYKFLPDRLEVPPGAEVVGMNFGPSDPSIPKDQWGEFYHTITASADRALFDVQRIPPDASPHPFRAPMTPGTYPYFCAYHGDAQGNGMVGTLIVTQPPANPPTITPGATPDANETPAPWVALTLGGVVAALLIARRR